MKKINLVTRFILMAVLAGGMAFLTNAIAAASDNSAGSAISAAVPAGFSVTETTTGVLISGPMCETGSRSACGTGEQPGFDCCLFAWDICVDICDYCGVYSFSCGGAFGLACRAHCNCNTCVY